MMAPLSKIRDTAKVHKSIVQATDMMVSGSRMRLTVMVKNLSEMGESMKVASVRVRSQEKVR